MAEPVTDVVPAETLPIGLHTFATAYRDYTKKSFEETRSLVEKLSQVRSLDKAVEVQTEFAKRAFDNFVAEFAENARTLWQARQADLQASGKFREQIDTTTLNPPAPVISAQPCV